MRYMLAFVIVLSGCAVTPAATALGNGRYTLGANSRSPDSAHAESIKQASAYCVSQGKAVNAESFSEETGASVYRSNIVFTCN
jgi:hypothetical protein